MLRWFIRFDEFAEFNEKSAPFMENSIKLGAEKILTLDPGFVCISKYNRTNMSNALKTVRSHLP